MIVCSCKAVTSADLACAIRCGAKTLEDVGRCTRAGTGCGACHTAIQQTLDMAQGRIAKPVIRLTMAAIVGS